MDTPKVWYVTGSSQGLGHTLVKKLLETGHRVAATSRNIQALKKAIGPVDAAHFLPHCVAHSYRLAGPSKEKACLRECRQAFS